MKRYIILIVIFTFIFTFLAGCTILEEESGEAEEYKITDMAGREVVIPENIESVYSASPIGTISLYTLAPDKLAGWSTSLWPNEKEYIKEEYHDLPVLGIWRGSDSTGNIEEILRVSPDIIINKGDVDSAHIEISNEIEEQLNIPVVMVDGSLEKMEEAYEFLGKILDEEERAQELAAYSSEVLADIKEFEENLPEDERKEVYYAAGSQGLETSPKGSINTEVLDFVGGENVVVTSNDIRRMDVNLEQVIVWDPELIIISANGDGDNDGPYETIRSQKGWKDIRAVRNELVFEIPRAPFDWFNRPPSVTRLIGLQWLANLIYPEKYDIDIEDEVKEYMEKFFFYELSDEEVTEILKRSRR